MFQQRFGFEYLISFVAEDSDAQGILGETNDLCSKIEKIDTNKRKCWLENSNLAK